MMSAKHGKRYTSRFKFQVVLEVLTGAKNIGQIAKMYGVHPIMCPKLSNTSLRLGPMTKQVTA